MSLIKLLMRLLLVLVVLLVIVVIAVPMFLDPNDYKQQIVEQVKQSTGRDLVIDGDLGLSFFPWLGLETGALSLGNAQGFGEQAFATVASSEIAVKVLPLLKGRVETGTITLKGVELNLARDSKGRANWKDLASSAETDAKPGKDANERTEDPGADADANVDEGEDKALEFDIGGVVVEGATLRWNDAASGESLFFDDIDLRTGAVRAGEPVEVHLDMGIDRSAPAMRGNLVMDAAVLVDAGRVLLSGMQLALRLNGQGVPNGAVSMDLQAAAAVDSAAEVLELKPLKLTLDQSHLDGSIKIHGFAEPAVQFALEVDQIDLDAYLPSATDGEATAAGQAASQPVRAGRVQPAPATAVASPAPSTAPGATGDSGLPLDTLRSLNLDGSLRIGKLKAGGLRMQNMVAALKARDGVIALSPARLALYQGSFDGGVNLDARGDTLNSKLKWQLNGVQLGPLLADLNGEESLSGTARLDADLRLNGNDAEAMTRSVSGSASMQLTDGAYQGIDLMYEVRLAKALLKGKTLPPPGRIATDFAVLSGSFRLKNGVVSNSDLKAKSPVLRVNGAGTVNLPQESLDYGLDVTITGTLEGQGGKELENLKGVQIPITLTGKLSEPKVGVSVEKLLKGEVEKRLQGELDKRLGDILGTDGGSQQGSGGDGGSSGSTTDSLKKAIPGVLKGLFN